MALSVVHSQGGDRHGLVPIVRINDTVPIPGLTSFQLKRRPDPNKRRC